MHLGEHVTLQFEDELLIRYQIQEMLRIERIFEEEGIQGELDAYNPLMPDGGNWKATMLIEYPDADERRRMLARLKGVERRVWVQVDGAARVYADRRRGPRARERGEDLGGAFPALRARRRHARARCAAAPRSPIGVDHPAYARALEVAPEMRASLAGDLA